MQVYNNRLENDNLLCLQNYARAIFQQQNHVFKMNLSFGFMMKNFETEEVKHFYSSNNTKLLREPVLVRNEDSLKKVYESLETEDISDYIRKQRPNLKWKVTMVTILSFNGRGLFEIVVHS